MKTFYIQYEVETTLFDVIEVHTGDPLPFTSPAGRLPGGDCTRFRCYNPNIEEGKSQIKEAVLRWVADERKYLDSVESSIRNA